MWPYNLRMLNIAFSRKLAVVAGIVLPVLETIRRRHEWPGPPQTWQHWMDDYLVAALLLAAAWKSRPRTTTDSPRSVWTASYLTAAWGFACGLGFGSVLSQVNVMLNPALGSEPSGLPHGWMIAIKAGLLGLGIVGLVASMQPGRRSEGESIASARTTQ